MAKTLDQIDSKMIALLRENARMPLVALAQRIGLSRSATQERLKRLEDHGVIGRYTIQFHPPAVDVVRAWLWIRFARGYQCRDVVPFILQRPEVRLCHSVTGPIDLVVLVEAESPLALSDLRDALAGYPFIDEVQTAPVLVAHYDPVPG
jgi:Lrp/AsnC family transcriptional regulator, leucine-responsive regulatory protein